MQIAVFPELNEQRPLFRLVVLHGNPSVIYPKIGIIRKLDRGFLLLQVYCPVEIIGGGIDEMTKYLFDCSVLSVFSIVEDIRLYPG